MLERFNFYIRHSLNDLRVNRQRTFFALLAIAAGVAAIVSLQTLAVMIEDTLTGNLQQQNRADIQINPPFFIPDELNEEDLPPDALEDFTDRGEAQEAFDEGLLVEQSVLSIGGESTDVGFTEAAVEDFQQWLDENISTEAELTYRTSITQFFNILTGTGQGTSLDLVDSDARVTQVTPVIINPDEYPFYDTVTTLDGTPLAEVIDSPTDIVLSRNAADVAEVAVGDQVRIGGATEVFTIAGIAAVEEEATSGFASGNPFIGLYGFYYLDQEALPFFEGATPIINLIYLSLEDETAVQQVDEQLNEAYGYIDTTSTEDLREQNEQISEALDTLVTSMGLLSLLIGSIAIVNTMQVIVRRRTTEIAVLKTVGLQGNQVTLLFLTEAVIMGIIGSIFGVLLGWAGTFVLREGAAFLTGDTLAFQIALEPVVNGIVVGTLVTTIFGFIPTLSAGQVRPGIVLRPSDRVVPRAGFLRTLAALVVIIIALSLIAQSLLGGNTAQAFAIVGGAFFAAGVLYVILLFLIWLIGRFLPKFGLVDLKISMRQMVVGRGRGAITLLALVVGVFALSTITMFSQSITNLLDFSLEQGAPGNVVVQGLTGSEDQVVERLETLQSEGTIDSYELQRSFNSELQMIELAGGESLTPEEFFQRQEEAAQAASEDGSYTVYSLNVSSIEAIEPDQINTDAQVVEGRQLTPEDAGEPVAVLTFDEETRPEGIEVGDSITVELEGGRSGLIGQAPTETVTLEIVGIIVNAQGAGDVSFFTFPSDVTALLSSLPDITPTSTVIFANVPEENIAEVRRAVSDLPGAFVLELDLLVDLVRTLIGQFQAFPTLVAALGLVVGGVVIANSVALSTIERRREIAVMKSIGLQRERVLGMLLLENAMLGLIGGLIGVGIGFVGLIVFSAQLELPSETLPFATAFGLMALCIGVALVAALTTAWDASGEKPLNVLRVE